LREARVFEIDKARQQGLINDAEAAQLRAAAQAVAAAIAVDDFAREELAPRQVLGEVLSQAMPRPTAAE
jgi:acyl-CoA dehydrogenase